ncbi:hypothetical protein HDU86_005859 [Geranomyces michiganensis]|nr:hypothetical protein HDU86_005859 [Geranomyces michiganensis]
MYNGSLNLKLLIVPARVALASTPKLPATASASNLFALRSRTNTKRFLATNTTSAAIQTTTGSSSSKTKPRRSNDLPHNLPLFRQFNRALDSRQPLEQWRLYNAVYKAGDAKFMSLNAFKKMIECIREKRVLLVNTDEYRLGLTNNLWEALKESSVTIDEPLLSSFLQVYGRLGDLNGVNAVLSELKTMRIDVNKLGYQTWAMMAYARSGKQTEARAIYDKFKDKVDHDAALPNLYLYGLTNGADPERLKLALALFKEMKANGWKPDNNTYNHIIALYARMKQTDEMLAWFQKRRAEIRSEPPAAMYNQVLWGLLHAERWQEARDMLDRMAERGVKPDRRTADRAVAIGEKLGDAVLAWKYGASPPGDGYESTNPKTLESLAKVVGPATAGQEGFDKFKAILDAAGAMIQPKFLAKLIRGYRRMGDGSSAAAVLTWFPLAGLKPSTSVSMSVISAYANNDELDAAKALASSWQPEDTPIQVWTTLMMACKRVGDDASALSILKKYAPGHKFFPRDVVDTLAEKYGRDDAVYKASADVLRRKISEYRPTHPLDI